MFQLFTFEKVSYSVSATLFHCTVITAMITTAKTAITGISTPATAASATNIMTYLSMHTHIHTHTHRHARTGRHEASL